MGGVPLFIKIFLVAGILLTIAIFVFVIMFMFGTKTRSKFMARQMKSLRGMTDLSKDDIEKMMTNLSGATIKSSKAILEENEDDLKDIADANARINKDAIKETSKAIKDGFTSNDTKYCKYCGESIDSDSLYCKNCGKKQ